MESDEELTTIDIGSLGTCDSDTHAVDPTGVFVQMVPLEANHSSVV